jgi:SAM-dependent methyltransferase
LQAVLECKRVLQSGGRLVITVPLDGRPNGQNRPGYPEGLPLDDCGNDTELPAGITMHHQTYWSNEMLWKLREGAGLIDREIRALMYMTVGPMMGWGLVWEKP